MSKRAIPDFLLKDHLENMDARKGNVSLVQKANNINATVEHNCFVVMNNATDRNEDQPRCPPLTMRDKRDGTGQYPAKIVTKVKVHSLNRLENACVPDPENSSRYRVLAKLDVVNRPQVEKWIKDNVQKLYADENAFDQRANKTMRSFIGPDGEIPDKFWADIYLGSTYKMKVGDNINSLYRQKLNDSELPLVHERTILNASNISVEAWIYMGDLKYKDGEEEKTMKIPRVSVSLVPRDVVLGEGEKHYKTPCQKIEETENPDQHLCVPLIDYKEKNLYPVKRAYMRIQQQYSSLNGCSTGVTTFITPPESSEETVKSSQDGTKRRVLRVTTSRYEWSGSWEDASFEEKLNKYAVLLQASKNDSETVTAKFGIPDPETYGFIRFAHYDIPFHAWVTLWGSRTFYDTPKNDPALLAEDDKCDGYYTYLVTDIEPMYRTYFENSGAIQISRDKFTELFDDHMRVDQKRGTSLVLRYNGAMNHLNAHGEYSDVVALGDAKKHLFNGDAWPLVEQSTIYVLTSHRLSDEEKLSICGPRADLTKADARFDELINTPGIIYQVFLLKNQQPEPMDLDDGDAEPEEEVEEQEEEEPPQKKKKIVRRKKK